MLFPPSLQLPTDNWRSAGQLAGPVHENGQTMTTQSVRYPQSVWYMVTACSQPGQATWRVGSKVYVCWSVFISNRLGWHTTWVEYSEKGNWISIEYFQDLKTSAQFNYYSSKIHSPPFILFGKKLQNNIGFLKLGRKNITGWNESTLAGNSVLNSFFTASVENSVYWKFLYICVFLLQKSQLCW